MKHHDKNKVEFILVGGFAVVYYGYHRTTGDMDILLKPTSENKKRIPIIHPNHLILSTLSSNRLKDKADVEEFKK